MQVDDTEHCVRHLFAVLDIAGLVLLAGGLVGLAGLVHPFLAAAVAGAFLLAVAFVFEPRSRGGDG